MERRKTDIYKAIDAMFNIQAVTLTYSRCLHCQHRMYSHCFGAHAFLISASNSDLLLLFNCLIVTNAGALLSSQWLSLRSGHVNSVYHKSVDSLCYFHISKIVQSREWILEFKLYVLWFGPNVVFSCAVDDFVQHQDTTNNFSGKIRSEKELEFQTLFMFDSVNCEAFGSLLDTATLYRTFFHQIVSGELCLNRIKRDDYEKF